jgi:predicted TIM-barrel fold metal-dependent hydrolase
MSKEPYRIDVHHHIVPVDYIAGLAKIGITNSLGKAFPEWSVQKSLDLMDANGIKTAITSLSSPGVFFGNIQEDSRLARMCNETSAEIIRNHPDRFGSFATLPLPDVHEALKELIYAMDTLKLDGVVLMSNYFGLYVGDQNFQELYAELNKRKAVVYVHPTDPVAGNPLGRDIPTFLMEVTFETARVIFNLLYKGVLEKYPEIKWIFSHAGGVMPYIAWRVMLGQFIIPDANQTVPQGVTYYLKKLFYDTGLSANPHALSSLRELVEPSQILFGTDYPFAPDLVTAETVKGLRYYRGFSTEEMDAIEFGNALNLFPRLRKKVY